MPIPTAAEISELVYEGIQQSSKLSDRSMQSQDFKVGISDLGHCHEYVRRMIIQEPESDERDVLAAFLGTAIGDHVEDAIEKIWPGSVRGLEVEAELHGLHGSYKVPGHPDIVHMSGGVIDAKSKHGLVSVRRTGATEQQNFQRHGYMLGLLQKGYFADVPPEELWVANVWVDRSGSTRSVHTEVVQYDPKVIEDMTAWLDDVIYAVIHGEEAQRDQPIEFCQNWCERYSACRGADTRTIGGIISDPRLVEAAQLYKMGREMAKDAESMKDEAKTVLLEPGPDGHPHLNGIVDDEVVRAVWTNPFERKGGRTEGSWSVRFSKVPKGKPKKSD